MEINKDTSFIETYFDNKVGEKLMMAITPTWTDKQLQSHINIVRTPESAFSVLEVGCGIGRLLKPICKSGKFCYGVDASKAMVDEARKYLSDCENSLIMMCDGNGCIPMKDNLVDFSFSIITFQHIPNTETVKKYISEMIRCTKSGGEVMFQVLYYDMDRGYLWSYHDLDELSKYVKSLGITNCDLIKYNNWGIFRCRV